MADEVRRAEYYVATIPHRAGQGAKILNAFREAKVNFRAIHAFPEGGKAQIDFFPEDSKAFERAAKEAGIRVRRGRGAFLIEGRDRLGAVADILGTLGDAKVNVTALDAVSTGGKFGAIVWVKPDKADAAAKALGAKR